MKVIQVIPNLNLAGAEIMCENLVYSLRSMGVEVVVISLYSQKSAITDRMDSAGVDIRYLGKKRGLDLSMIGKLKKVFKEEKPDVIHTHLYSFQYAVPAAIMAGVKGRVHTVHSIASKELSKTKRILAKCFYKYHRLVPVALSSAVRDSIVQEYGLPQQKIPVVFNGIDLSKCIPKNEHGYTDKFKIVHIGRFQEPKNHPMLIRSFAKFHQAHPDTVLRLIGDGAGREDAEKLVDELGIADAVEFLGLQSNVYGYLHDADVFTLPSLYEGIPMTLIEAMGTGLPIVATRVGGIPDMIDNSNSILTDVDVDQIATALETYYLSEKLREKHGRDVTVRAKDFSSDEMADRYVNIYQGGVQ